MARVAMLRFVSEIRFSKSTLQEVTMSGWNMAIWNGEWKHGNRIMRIETLERDMAA